MDIVRLRVEATGGVQVQVDQRVENGTVIGLRGEGQVVVDIAGVVESIVFDGEKHEFEVVIRAE